MTLEWQGAWQAVIHHPLFGIGITLGAYQLVLAAFEKPAGFSCNRCWPQCCW